MRNHSVPTIWGDAGESLLRSPLVRTMFPDIDHANDERIDTMAYLEQVLLPKVLVELKKFKTADPELIAEVRAALGTEAPAEDESAEA